MAIEPFRRRTTVPGGVPLTQVRTVNIPDIGPAIQDLGQQIAGITAPIEKQKLEEAALRDFAATGIAKDEEGNLQLPETPKAGGIYTRKFEELALTAYRDQSFNDVENRLTDLYTNAESLKKSALNLQQEGEAIIAGTIEAADPRIRDGLYRDLTRELRQRDLQRSNYEQRKQVEFLSANYKQSMQAGAEKAYQYASLGGEKGDAGYQAEYLEGKRRTQEMIDSGLIPPEAMADFETDMASLRQAGTMLYTVNAAIRDETVTSSELENLVDIITGANTTDSVLNISFEGNIGKLRPDHANKIAASITKLQQTLFGKEKQAAEDEAYGMIDAMVPTNGDFDPSMSDEDKLSWVRQFGARNEIDLNSPVGYAQLANRIAVGSIPKKLYTKVFSNLSSRSPQHIDMAVALAKSMENAQTPDGSTVDQRANFIEKEDMRFLEAYELAKDFGQTDPIAYAREVIQKDKPETITAAKSAINARFDEGTKYNEKIVELIEDSNLDYKALRQDDIDDIQIYASQLITTGVSLERAFLIASNGLKARRTLVESTSTVYDAAIKGRSSGPLGLSRINQVYIDPKELPTTVSNRINPSKNSTDYVNTYVNLAIKKLAGDQLSNVPPLAKLVAGENVLIKYVGGSVDKKSRLFTLIYYDRKTGDQAILRDKRGQVLTIDLGHAASIQQRASLDYAASWRQSMDRGESLAQQAYNYEVPFSSFFSKMIGGDGTPNRFGVKSAAAAKEYEAWQSEHNKKFGPLSTSIEGYTDDLVTIKKRGEKTPVKKYADVGLGQEPSVEHIQLPPIREQMRQNALGGTSPANAVRLMARNLGLKDYQLAAILMKESSLDPTRVNSDGYVGLFQASPLVQKALKINKGDGFDSQISKLPLYLLGKGNGLGDTKYRRGMGWQKLYAAILAGNAHAGGSVKDKNGSLNKHWNDIRNRFDSAKKWLENN